MGAKPPPKRGAEGRSHTALSYFCYYIAYVPHPVTHASEPAREVMSHVLWSFLSASTGESPKEPQPTGPARTKRRRWTKFWY